MTQNSSLRNEAICKHLNYSLHPSVFLEQGLGLNKRKISVPVHVRNYFCGCKIWQNDQHFIATFLISI